jgi:hypothetical protein
MSVSLQMDTALDKRSERASKYSRRLLSSPLHKRDTWIAYFACVVPAMTYTFPVTHHSAKKLRRLQSRPTLMKLGFNRNTAKVVAYGPSRYGALGLRDWPTEQGIAQLILLLRHLQGNTEPGKLLLISLSWWHLYSGVSYQLLQDPFPPLAFRDHHIFTALRSFLREINGSFYVADLDAMLPSPNRVGDVCLIAAVAALPDLSAADLRKFQRCCMYLQVAFLSELFTADGTVGTLPNGYVRASPLPRLLNTRVPRG